jgi:hypothetical protein
MRIERSTHAELSEADRDADTAIRSQRGFPAFDAFDFDLSKVRIGLGQVHITIF